MELFKRWIPLAVAITGICALIYGAVQQTYRQNLNDPQIAIAENAAIALEAGAKPEELMPVGTIDIIRSLSPWFGIYGMDKKPLASNAVFHDTTPTPPEGVFDAARNGQGKWNVLRTPNVSNQNRVTWQPESGVRQALVVVAYKDGYIVAGRNMREVEARVDVLTKQIAIGYAVLLLATFAAVYLLRYL